MQKISNIAKSISQKGKNKVKKTTETYEDFLDRINSFEKSEIDFGNNFFNVNPSLKNKVDEKNGFKNFYGDTVVFDLDKSTKEKISKIVDKLFHECPECFCEKLVGNTFHVTLHDLSNSPELREVATEIFYNELKIIELIKQIDLQTIKMKPKYVFNMVNTSLVLGLYPINETEFSKIMDLYNLVDNVKTRPYPFTPHITLGYYNIKGFNVQSAKKLESLVSEINQTSLDMEIELDVQNLFYQKFVNMNKYINVINFGKSSK